MHQKISSANEGHFAKYGGGGGGGGGGGIMTLLSCHASAGITSSLDDIILFNKNDRKDLMALEKLSIRSRSLNLERVCEQKCVNEISVIDNSRNCHLTTSSTNNGKYFTKCRHCMAISSLAAMEFVDITSGRQPMVKISSKCYFRLSNPRRYPKHIEVIVFCSAKGPYLPCVSMASGALLAGYPRYINGFG